MLSIRTPGIVPLIQTQAHEVLIADYMTHISGNRF